MVHLSHVAPQSKTCGVDNDDCGYTKPWRFQIGSRPKCIVFWGLEDEAMEIWRIAGTCEEYRAKLCDPDCIEEGCDYLFDKPGLYEVRKCDGSEDMPESFFPEEISLSVPYTQMLKTGQCKA